MANINDLISTFDALKPGLSADFATRVTATLNRLIETYGDKIGKLGNAYGVDGHAFRAYGYRFLTWPSRSGIRTGELPSGINTERLAKCAQQYADDQIDAFTFKLVRKLGTLTNVEIHDLNLGGFTFRISGELGGRKVYVEQSRIINVSPKGNLFHQWPALIYVDGKKTPEAAFKKLVA